MRSLHRDTVQLSTTRNASEGALKVPLFFAQNTMDTRLLLLPVTALGMAISAVNYLLFWYDFLSFPSKSADLAWRVGSGFSIALSGAMLGSIIIVNFFYLLSRPPFSFAIAEVLSNAALFFVNRSFFIWFVPHVLARTMLLLVSFASLRPLPPLPYIPHFS